MSLLPSCRRVLLVVWLAAACVLHPSAAPGQEPARPQAAVPQAAAPDLLDAVGPPVPPDEARAVPGVRRRSGVRPRAGVLGDARRTSAERITLQLPGAGRLVLRRQRHVALDDDGVYWSGRPEGAPASVPAEEGAASFVMRGGTLAGHVQVAGRTFLIRQQDGGAHVVDEVDPADEPVCDGGRVPLPGEPGSPQAGQLPGTSASSSGPVLDLLVVYTGVARAAAGGTAAIRASIDLGVIQMNESLANSDVTGRVRLLESREVAYDESRSMDTDLTRLTNRHDGFMDEVHAVRDQLGADLVTLITEHSDEGWAGLAWLMTTVSTSSASHGFSVVRRRSLTSYTLAHELGHNLGLVHDWGNANGDGAYPYAYGYRDPPYFRDVMAYSCPSVSCPTIPHFSNPQVFYQGRPTGTAQREDAARVLRQTLPVAAGYRMGAAPTLTSVSPAWGPTTGSVRVVLSGTNLWAVSRVFFGPYEATGLLYLSGEAVSVVAPWHPQGPVDVRAQDAEGNVLTLASAFAFHPSATDADGDALPDDWEEAMGLDPAVGTGSNGAYGDPDGDGVTNIEEWRTHGHPRGFFRRYFAEGATGSFFETRIALLNPHAEGAGAVLRYLLPDGTVRGTWTAVPSRSRRTIAVASTAGMANTAFSTVIESDRPLVADRTMTWDVASGYGAHAETSVAAPSPIWYLAEGATHSGFRLFYLLQNPSASPAAVRVRYLRAAGPPLEKTYTLPPRSRADILVNQELFSGLGMALASADVSAVIESVGGIPIIVERAMYLDNQGRPFNAGHASAGVTAPALQWFLAEGATGPYFDLFVLIANPNPADAEVTVTYLLQGGVTYSRPLVVRAQSRETIWVDGEQIPGVPGLPLADEAVSTRVTSTNGVPIIVERAMWWPGDFATWHEAHNSAGSTTTGTRWGLAEGEVGGVRGAETYILIANTSAFAGNATVTLVFEDGPSLATDYVLPAQSRTNVVVAEHFGAVVQGRRFGAVVESTGETPAQIVVERAMYSNAAGVGWAAGTNALGTRLQ